MQLVESSLSNPTCEARQIIRYAHAHGFTAMPIQ